MTRPVNDRMKPRLTKSVQRALDILEVVASGQHEMGIVEISQRVKLPVSTVHRLLTTLADRKFITQNSETGRYRIGIRAFEIGNRFLEQTQLRDIAHPVMLELARKVNESINLAILDGFSAIYIDQVESERLLKIFTRSGVRVPLHCTGVGKVLLAGFSDEYIEHILSSVELLPRTPNTITRPDMLLAHINLVRNQGYALDDEEFEEGVRCVAAPIKNYRGETVAALSISGPVSRMMKEQLGAYIEALCEASKAISLQLGW